MLDEVGSWEISSLPDVGLHRLQRTAPLEEISDRTPALLGDSAKGKRARSRKSNASGACATMKQKQFFSSLYVPTDVRRDFSQQNSTTPELTC